MTGTIYSPLFVLEWSSEQWHCDMLQRAKPLLFIILWLRDVEMYKPSSFTTLGFFLRRHQFQMSTDTWSCWVSRSSLNDNVLVEVWFFRSGSYRRCGRLFSLEMVNDAKTKLLDFSDQSFHQMKKLASIPSKCSILLKDIEQGCLFIQGIKEDTFGEEKCEKKCLDSGGRWMWTLS